MSRARAVLAAARRRPVRVATVAAVVTAAAVATVTDWGWYYLTVLGLAVIPECFWVVVNSRNTISAQIWGLERLDFAHPLNLAEWTPMHWVIAGLLWGLFGWLSIHLPTGYLR